MAKFITQDLHDLVVCAEAVRVYNYCNTRLIFPNFTSTLENTRQKGILNLQPGKVMLTEYMNANLFKFINHGNISSNEAKSLLPLNVFENGKWILLSESRGFYAALIIKLKEYQYVFKENVTLINRLMIDAENSLMLAQGIHINNEEKATKERKNAIGYDIITKLLFTETNKIVSIVAEYNGCISD